MNGMRKIVMWGMSTLTVLVLLFGYHTSTEGASPVSQAVRPVTSAESGGSSSAGTVTGPVAQTQWGPVQVQVTFTGSTISDVQVVQYPNGNHRDQEINDYALPILVQETKDANSADIDMVSGATVTSDGYRQSLQGALDQAGR
jgi:uncharacterized protein with FMN-binding domain